MAILIVFLFTLAYTLPAFGSKIQSQMLNFSVMVLAVLPFQTFTIIIKNIEYKFDSCHLAPTDHPDQKEVSKKTF